MKRTVLIISMILFGFSAFSQNTSNAEINRFGVKAGYSVIQHLEPQISGQNMTNQQILTHGGILSGLETMNGIDVKVYYYFKNHFGLYLNMGFANSENSVEYQNYTEPFIQYHTSADFISPSIGFASKFTFEKIQSNIIVGTSIGYFGYNMSYSQTANGSGQWYDGTYNILKAGFEAQIEYEIFKGLNLFSEINYSTQLAVDADNLYLEYTNDAGDFYNIVYNSPSMAALSLSFGIGYNF